MLSVRGSFLVHCRFLPAADAETCGSDTDILPDPTTSSESGTDASDADAHHSDFDADEGDKEGHDAVEETNHSAPETEEDAKKDDGHAKNTSAIKGGNGAKRQAGQNRHVVVLPPREASSETKPHVGIVSKYVAQVHSIRSPRRLKPLCTCSSCSGTTSWQVFSPFLSLILCPFPPFFWLYWFASFIR